MKAIAILAVFAIFMFAAGMAAPGAPEALKPAEQYYYGGYYPSYGHSAYAGYAYPGVYGAYYVR
jgi:hypothetical protein